MLKTSKENEIIVSNICIAFINEDEADKLKIEECSKLLESNHCFRGQLQLLSNFEMENHDLNYKFIELCVRLQHYEELSRFFKKDTAFYDVQKVKDFLVGAKMHEYQPILIFFDKHNFDEELELFLKKIGKQNKEAEIISGHSDSDK